MTKQQHKIISDSYDWIVLVTENQKRILPVDILWLGYPFKRDGLTYEGLKLLVDEMYKLLKNNPPN